MKMNLKNKSVVRNILGWTAAFACVFLALGIASYQKSEQKLALVTHDQALMDKLRDTAEQNKLIQLLNNGQVDAAKALINEQLAYNLKVIDTLTTPAGSGTQNFAKVVKADIAKDEHKHPSYYLASTKPVSLSGTTVVQMVRH